MSTNANIATITKDGKIKSIYCHWDGDLEFVGRILVNHYSDFEKTSKLVELGDISSLGEEIEPSEAVKRFGFDYACTHDFNSLPEKEKNRLYDEAKTHVTAYHRDRGEDLSRDKTRIFDNLPQYLNFMKKGAQEYNYLLAFNSEHKPQWYLLQNEGFMPLIDDPDYKDKSKNTINIADFDQDGFAKKISDCRSTMIQEFLRCLGIKYNLGRNRSKDIRVSKHDGEYYVEYFDPSSNVCFPIRFMDGFEPQSVTVNFAQYVLREIVEGVKTQLYKSYPVYTKEEISKLSQINDLKQMIVSFYRKKYDPDNKAFNYFLDLCHDQTLKDQADEGGYCVQKWQLEADRRKDFIKPYVLKKVDKLFSELKENKIKGVDITHQEISAYTDYSVKNKWGIDAERSKFSDYLYNVEQGKNPADDSLFADPLLNSQLYSIFKDLYQQELIKDMEHKLDQAVVLQNK